MNSGSCGRYRVVTNKRFVGLATHEVEVPRVPRRGFGRQRLACVVGEHLQHFEAKHVQLKKLISQRCVVDGNAELVRPIDPNRPSRAAIVSVLTQPAIVPQAPDQVPGAVLDSGGRQTWSAKAETWHCPGPFARTGTVEIVRGEQEDATRRQRTRWTSPSTR